MPHFSIVDLIGQHPYATLACYYLFSNLVLTMPPPEPNGSKWYKWLFGFLHGVAGAFPRVAANFLPPGSFFYKLLAGGNGVVVNPQISTDTKVDGAAPKA
jgi:hypothetical protein